MKVSKKLIRFSVILILVILILLFRFTDEIGLDKHPLDRFLISKVIDGDTVELNGGDKLRLLSVDTPEKDELFYDRAKELVTDLALNKHGRIEYANRRRDAYGRLLGYLYIDTLFVNKIILDSGLGYLYLFKDTDINNEQTGILLKSQQQAIDLKLGIWSLEKNEEDFYYNPPGSLRLHRPGCRTLSDSNKGNYRKIENRFDGFYEGLSPCRICKP